MGLAFKRLRPSHPSKGTSMTREEIIKLANEAELCQTIWIEEDCIEIESVIQFAKLVAEREREACAKFCETHAVWVGRGKRGFSEWSEEDSATGGRHQGMDYAAAIRARGQA